MKPFDVISHLSSSKVKNFDEETEKGYNPFLVNRFFSQYVDTIPYANEMNSLASSKLHKQAQYDFYHFGVKVKKKRFAAWAKPIKDESVDIISSFYKCSKLTAEQYSKFLTDTDIIEMQEKMAKGGRK